MNKYITMMRAVCVESGELKTYIGADILANSWNEAEEYCRLYAPYLTVYGEKVVELSEDTLKPINLQLN